MRRRHRRCQSKALALCFACLTSDGPNARPHRVEEQCEPKDLRYSAPTIPTPNPSAGSEGRGSSPQVRHGRYWCELKSRRAAQLEIARQKRTSSEELLCVAARRSPVCGDIGASSCVWILVACLLIVWSIFGARAFASAVDSDVIALWYRVMILASSRMVV